MIADFGVHHGLAACPSDIFEDDLVLFVSTRTEASRGREMSDAGEGGGVGATINVPHPRVSDAAARSRRLTRSWPGGWVRAGHRPQGPQGTTRHWRDPLAGLSFRTGTYWRLSARVKALADELCGGRCVFAGRIRPDGSRRRASRIRSRALLEDRSGEDPGAIAGLTDEPTEKVRRVLAEAKAMHQL